MLRQQLPNRVHLGRPDGQRLVYSTYLGGSDEEWGYAVAVAPGGNLIAVGQTSSTNFPIRAAWQTTNASVAGIYLPADAYVTKVTPTVEAPELKIARSGSNVLLLWATNFTGFALESTGALAPNAVGWQPVGVAPVVLGGQFTVVQHAGSSNQFFRLRRP